MAIVSTSENKNTITVSGDTAKYYGDLAKQYRDECKMYADNTATDVQTVLNKVDEINEATETSVVNISNMQTIAINAIDEQMTVATANIALEAEEAKKWANYMDGTVDEEEYSAKYYATQAQEEHSQALTDIASALSSSETDIEVARQTAITLVETTANTAINDINSTGKSYDNLTYRNVTNCITEIPQRIKYTLEDGTLTIKAGTVAIVPYGLEDLTETYPVGSTFINDNFKVVDTQYANGKFFVWVEVQNDASISTFGSTAANVQITYGSSAWNDEFSINYFVTNIYSGATQPTTTSTNSLWYDTENNVIKTTADKGTTWVETIGTLPLMNGFVSSRTMTTINQVFNGIGYIGSTIFVDKDVKALFPDGTNPDGTVNNINWTNPQISVYTLGNITNYNYNFSLYFSSKPTANSPLDGIGVWTRNNIYESTTAPVTPGTNVSALWYNPDTKIWLQTVNDGVWTQTWRCPMATALATSGVISSFSQRQTFTAADAQDIPGVWHAVSTITIANSVSITNTNTIYSLADYLPNDGVVYEVLLDGLVTTTATSGAYINLYISSDILTSAPSVCGVRARTAATVDAKGNIILPVGKGRYINVSGNATPNGTYTVRMFGYRKIRG